MMKLETDSGDYELLQRAASNAPWGPDFPWLEIGTREGGSTQMLLETLPEDGVLVSVDPYGGIPYKAFVGADSFTPIHWDWIPGEASSLGYTSAMRTRATIALLEIAAQRGVHFIPLPITDLEFMERFVSGVPVHWNGHSRLRNTYGLVFLDGPHDTESVYRELRFFIPRMAERGLVVIDDWLPQVRGEWWGDLWQELGWAPVAQGPSKIVIARGRWGKRDE